MSRREMSVNGSFYPNSCQEIQRYISEFNNMQSVDIKPMFEPKAIIVPHAGYVYSGFTANCAYKIVDKNLFKRVVVIGPSHRSYIKGASIALYDYYDTPCGDLEIDTTYADILKERYDFLSFSDALHHEHSTEVQMPFVKHYLSDLKVIEIVYGDLKYQELVTLMQDILTDRDSLLVISTDLSHFYKLDDANTLDSICLEAIKNLNLEEIDKGCEACGIVGVKALLQAAKTLSLNSQLIDYRTSYDASGDSSSVVGYMSALIG